MEWLLLSLVCAFSVASADAATKKFLSDYAPRDIVIVRFVFSGLLLSPLLALQPWPHLPAAFWYWVCAMVPVEILAMWLYMSAIRSSPLGHTLPYLAFTPVFVALTGYLLLGERVTALGLQGILLVVCGAYLLNLEHASRLKLWWAPFRAIVHEKGSRLMLAVAALYSLTSVMGKGALQYVSPVFFAPFYFCVLAVVTAAVFCVRGPKLSQVLWRRPVWHLVIGGIMAVMIVTHLAAIQLVEVAYMIAVKRTSLLFGIAYGAVLFGESYLPRHLLAGMLMIAGVILIAM